MRQHKRDLPRTKKLLKSCLNQSPYEDQIAFKKDTPFAVKFDFGLDSSREFDIDLLPTFTTNQSPGKLGFLNHYAVTKPQYESVV